MDETRLWDDYQRTGHVDARNRLVEAHLPLVHHVARKLLRRSGGADELDELLGAGAVGLLSAVENFDPERGLAFSTFAIPRIRGAILDDQRRRDHVPRSVRRKQRDLKRARAHLAQELERAPRRDEVARELGVEMEKVATWEVDAQADRWVSMDRPLDDDEGRATTPEELLPDDDIPLMDECLTREEELDRVREALMDLPEQERKVLALYYFEELKLRQIGGILGVTESRISQIRSAALRRLRGRLAPLREEVA